MNFYEVSWPSHSIDHAFPFPWLWNCIQNFPSSSSMYPKFIPYGSCKLRSICWYWFSFCHTINRIFSNQKMCRRYVIINNFTLFNSFVSCLGDAPNDDCNTGMSLRLIFHYHSYFVWPLACWKRAFISIQFSLHYKKSKSCFEEKIVVLRINFLKSRKIILIPSTR